ncbi:MAG: hypothetical protein Q8Q98_14705 [Polaromonas sp.]|nr:hypothetical protein [Polaromonas sp.]
MEAEKTIHPLFFLAQRRSISRLWPRPPPGVCLMSVGAPLSSRCGWTPGRKQRHFDRCLDATAIAALRCLPSDIYRNHAF